MRHVYQHNAGRPGTTELHAPHPSQGNYSDNLSGFVDGFRRNWRAGEGWDRNGRWQGGKEPIGGGHEGETGYVLRYWLPEATLNDFVFGFDIEVRTDACLSYLSVFLRDVFKYSSRCKLQPAP